MRAQLRSASQVSGLLPPLGSRSPARISPPSWPRQPPFSPPCLTPRSADRRGSAGLPDSAPRALGRCQAQPGPEPTPFLTQRSLTARSRHLTTGGPGGRSGRGNCPLGPRAHLRRSPHSTVLPPPSARLLASSLAGSTDVAPPSGPRGLAPGPRPPAPALSERSDRLSSSQRAGGS